MAAFKPIVVSFAILLAVSETYQIAAFEEFPEGWPQYAAFLHSQENFPSFKRFGLLHMRGLLHGQAELQRLEQKLLALDRTDAVPGSGHQWRLRMLDYENAPNSAQRDLLSTIQQKLLVYGKL